MTPNLLSSDREYLWLTNWHGRPLDERFGKLISKFDDSLSLSRQAANVRAPCDWGIDLSQGPVLSLPHLAPAKQLVQTTLLKARWNLQNGRQSEVRDDLLAALALGRNLSRDNLAISALVQFSIEALITRTVAANFFEFSPETLTQLVDGFDATLDRDVIAQCIPNEKYVYCDWFLARIKRFQQENPANETRVLDQIRELFHRSSTNEAEEKPDFPDMLIQVTGGTSAGVVNLLQQLAPFYQQLSVIMVMPYPQYPPQIEAFTARIEKLPNLFTPRLLSFDKWRRLEFAMQVRFAMIRAAVAYKHQGNQALASVADPCGNGAFVFQRFMFEGIDRGFKLTSGYRHDGYQETLIFVEKIGTPFFVDGNNAGKALLEPFREFSRRYGLEERTAEPKAQTGK
jgi:hypothetical protein